MTESNLYSYAVGRTVGFSLGDDYHRGKVTAVKDGLLTVACDTCGGEHVIDPLLQPERG